jgi:pimeloyl-ACP methyl ester carboxylesterase
VLVLRGEASDLLLAETAAQMGEAPGVRVETIAHCGHAPALMDPAQIALVADFLT